MAKSVRLEKYFVTWLTMPSGYALIMELRHLRYFIAVAEEENITRAAARLHLAQPSLSRQIRDLENNLDLALFVRSARALHLSDAGQAFLPEARAVVQRADDAMQMAKMIGSGQHSELHLGFAPSLTVELLPAALRHFQKSCPDVRVRLHDLSTQEMICGLREGKLHVALMIQTSAKEMTGIKFEPLRRFPVCIAAHPAHSLAQTDKVSIHDVAQERLIAYTRADYPEYHTWLAGLFARNERVPQIAEEHDGSTSLIASVEAGRGIALVQQGFECLSGPRLIIRPLSPAPPPFVVGLAMNRKESSEVAINFRKAIQIA